MLHVFDEIFAQTLSSQTHTRDETKTPTQTENRFLSGNCPLSFERFISNSGGGREERYRYYFLLKSLNMFTIQKLD